jgi:RNA polymerase sigma-70 factor (ECF subfamily)
VLLRAVLGLDATRAAAVLGKRPGAVRTAAHRGLRTLARHLDHTRRPRSDANAGVTQPENLALRDMR